MKFTNWFPITVKPYRKGIYQVEGLHYVQYQSWNGKFWGYRCDDAVSAENVKFVRSCFQDNIWRGIAK